MKNNILVVVAHPDDEVLGLGATLCKHRDQGEKISILILANGEDSRDTGADGSKRLTQAKAVAERLKATLYLENLPDNQFDAVPLLSIIKIIEKVINQVKPNSIYTHHIHDLNVDHRLTSQAVLTACRPQPGLGVKQIFNFEVPSSTEWQMKDGSLAFCPTDYSNVTDFIDEKIEILKLYSDELREYPHPRSLEGVKLLAQYRGLEVGYRYAEAFQRIRNLID